MTETKIGYVEVGLVAVMGLTLLSIVALGPPEPGEYYKLIPWLIAVTAVIALLAVIDD